MLLAKSQQEGMNSKRRGRTRKYTESKTYGRRRSQMQLVLFALVVIGSVWAISSMSFETPASLLDATIRETSQQTPTSSDTSSTNIRMQTTSLDENQQEEESIVAPVNCSIVPNIEPVNIARMGNLSIPPYLVSFSWWDKRLVGSNYLENGRKALLRASKPIRNIQTLLLSTASSPGAFIDVGANVGFMTNFATRDREVFAIDPISYDIAKLCEGYKANLGEGWAKPNTLHLYHAAAGPASQPNITITRPPDDVGYFDQSSLSADAVKNLHTKVVEEFIPMITVDSIVPDDVPVGIVKIDVQGHEFGVLQGMKRILGRTEGYPLHVFYEEQAPLLLSTQENSTSAGACAEFLQTFGYTCNTIKSDVLCSKP